MEDPWDVVPPPFPSPLIGHRRLSHAHWPLHGFLGLLSCHSVLPFAPHQAAAPLPPHTLFSYFCQVLISTLSCCPHPRLLTGGSGGACQPLPPIPLCPTLSLADNSCLVTSLPPTASPLISPLPAISVAGPMDWKPTQPTVFGIRSHTRCLRLTQAVLLGGGEGVAPSHNRP